MKPSGSVSAIAASAALLLASVSAQTYTSCNPLEGSCPSDPALGGTISHSFSSGASSDFTTQGDTVSYGSNGAEFTISQSGDSPQIVSNAYIMFGRVEIIMQAAPGAGIVSSAVLQSDDLDEIDWEWLGADPTSVQTNYFGKGITGTYNRGTTVADPTSQSAFNNYTLEWTSAQTVWIVNGEVVRTLTPATAEENQYPQTPMQVKIGAWSAGDPSNAPGVISWSGGPTNYAAGPFTMYVQSVSVTDYSTGSSYSYGGTSGSWQSIVSDGGSVYSGGSANAVAAAPEVTSADPQPDSSSYAPPTTLVTSPSATVTTYPGLPSGWTVASSGMVVPPSSATMHHRPLATSLHASPHSGAHVKTTQGPIKPVQTGSNRALLPGTSDSPQPTNLGGYTGGASGRHMISTGLAGCAIFCVALLL